MSWCDPRKAGRIGLAFLAALAMGGCLQPLNANRAPVVSSAGPVGAEAQNVLAAIDVLPVEGRVGQKVRNDLLFALTGGGAPLPPRYRLDVTVQVIRAQVAIVDPFTARPETQTAGVDAAYTLVEVGTGRPVLASNAIGRATYLRNRQRFASARAERDAEDRAARVVVEQIRARLLSHFAPGGA